MKIRRFIAPTITQAFQKVKEAMGEDAVIMSTQKVPEGIEIVAAIDTPEPSGLNGVPDRSATARDAAGAEGAFEAMLRQREPEATTTSATAVRGETTAGEPARAREAMEQVARMAEELRQMRALLEHQMSALAWERAERVAPGKLMLLKRLLSLGIDWALANRLVDALPPEYHDSDEGWARLLQQLAQLLQTLPQDITHSGGVIALVGPTGVGKTTTIAKIAGRFAMRYGISQLALVSTDGYKIGAQAQLQIFADMLGVPVHTAQTQPELYALLHKLQDKRLVLIDTAGMSQKDIRLTQQLTAALDDVLPVRNLLVVSAASALPVMREVVQAFSPLNLHGIVLTKLDEAALLGGAITLLAEQKLPLACMTEGQKVPEDLLSANVDLLIDRAIVLGNQYRQSMDATADDWVFRLGMGRETFNVH